jgi:hypothetical protein
MARLVELAERRHEWADPAPQHVGQLVVIDSETAANVGATGAAEVLIGDAVFQRFRDQPLAFIEREDGADRQDARSEVGDGHRELLERQWRPVGQAGHHWCGFWDHAKESGMVAVRHPLSSKNLGKLPCDAQDLLLFRQA